MAHPRLNERQDTLDQLWETSDDKKDLPEFLAKDAAKLLFLAVNPEKVARCGNTEYFMDKTIQRLCDKFKDALTQKNMIPVQREVQVKLLKLYGYEISSEFYDYISPEEEEILEINEIIRLLGYEPQAELQRKSDSIISNKHIKAPASDPDDKTTFFVYAENKVIMDICDALSPQDVIRYPIGSRPPGLCVIFCMLEGRSGAKEDLDNVSRNFKDVFKFEVVAFENPDAEEIKSAIKSLEAPKFKFYDSLVVFFMGHGSESSLLVKNGTIQRRKEFIDPIISIPWFVNKPKGFFIQACSTDDSKEKIKENRRPSALLTDTDFSKNFGVIASPSWTDKYAGFVDFTLSNNSADTIVSYATMWCQKAAINRDGSLYINTLMEKLCEYGSSESIENVLRRVHYYVSMVELTEDNEVSWKQAPYFESSLKKEFILPQRRNRS